MQVIHWCAVAVVLVFVASVGRADKTPEGKLPEAVATALDKATELEVYSLDGSQDAQDGWHDANVLGKTTIRKDADRKLLVTAIKKGVEEGGMPSKCFNPRHGIRVTHDGKTYDLLICFECHHLYIFTNDSDKPQVMPISDLPQKTFNNLLTEAKIKLAKPDSPEKPEKPEK